MLAFCHSVIAPQEKLEVLLSKKVKNIMCLHAVPNVSKILMRYTEILMFSEYPLTAPSLAHLVALCRTAKLLSHGLVPRTNGTMYYFILQRSSGPYGSNVLIKAWPSQWQASGVCRTSIYQSLLQQWNHWMCAQSPRPLLTFKLK